MGMTIPRLAQLPPRPEPPPAPPAKRKPHWNPPGQDQARAWPCEYCAGLQPGDLFRCDGCGAPRPAGARVTAARLHHASIRAGLRSVNDTRELEAFAPGMITIDYGVDVRVVGHHADGDPILFMAPRISPNRVVR